MAGIRTIKPEFWSHPVLGRLDDQSKNLALALLNYADDQGYFHADPILVRNFCRPFDEDSSIIRRSLAVLSEIGWIEVAESPQHGDVGRIVNFTSHQIIDRAKPSKIERYFDSSMIRRFVVDQSTLEGKGTGKGKEGKKDTSVAVATAVSDPLYTPVWQSFLAVQGTFSDYRKEGAVCKGLCAKIRSLSPEHPEEAAKAVLEKYRQMLESGDRFWSGQPFTPSGLSPQLDRIWTLVRKDSESAGVLAGMEVQF